MQRSLHRLLARRDWGESKEAAQRLQSFEERYRVSETPTRQRRLHTGGAAADHHEVLAYGIDRRYSVAFKADLRIDDAPDRLAPFDLGKAALQARPAGHDVVLLSEHHLPWQVRVRQ